MKKNIDIVVQKPKGLFIGLDVRILWAHQWSSSEYHLVESFRHITALTMPLVRWIGAVERSREKEDLQ